MREHSSRRHRSPSRERESDRRRDKSHKSRRYKKSKKSKKYSRRSSSSSSTSSYDSRESDYRSSSRRSGREKSSESSRASKTLATSSENSRTNPIVQPKTIDLTDDHVKEAIATIEEEKFEIKSFFSTRDREAPKKLATEKVVIDLNKETVQIPRPIEIKEITKEQIFHPNFLGDADLKTEKWARKLYNFRQKHFED